MKCGDDWYYFCTQQKMGDRCGVDRVIMAATADVCRAS